MLFSIIVFLMVVLVAMFWTYQGLLSSLIMFFETLVAFMLAVNFYEPLNGVWRESLGDGLGLPLAFALIFLITLFALREITDRVVKGNITLPMYVDRAGGGVVGLFTGLLLVGAALIPIQMLPIGSDIFSFERVTEVEGKRVVHKIGYLNPDGFAMWIANSLTDGRFGDSNKFEDAKPDLLMDMYGARDSTQTEDLHFIPQNAVEVTAYWFTDKIDQVHQSLGTSDKRLHREFDKEDADPGDRFLVAHVRVKMNAAPKDKPLIRFRLPQFRLFGPPPVEGSHTAPACYLGVGMTDLYVNVPLSMGSISEDQVRRLVHFNPQTNFILGENTTGKAAVKESDDAGHEHVTGFEFDVAFEVPEDFVPWYLEFKRGARFDFTKRAADKTFALKEPPDFAAIALGKGASTGAGGTTEFGEGPKGLVHVAHAIKENSGISSQLPTVLDLRDKAVSSVLQGGKFNDGQVVVELPEEAIPEEFRVTEFVVPEGFKMFQLGAEKNFPGSMFGQALNFAANVVAQIHVSDEEGANYYAIGVYAAVVQNGKWVFEIQYRPSEIETADHQGTLKKFTRVKDSLLKTAKANERKFGYVFLVKPGVTINKFFSGARAGAGQEIPPYKIPG